MITVALPAYKAEFLPEAIHSVLTQEYKDFELVILNDGSPMDIASIVRRFGDPRIRYSENPQNIGRFNLTKTWNDCLNLAQGDYFTLFADDDVMKPQYLGELLSLFDLWPSVNIVHCRVCLIGESGQTLGYVPTCPPFETGIEFMWHRMRDLRFHYAADFMCRTKALREIGGFVTLPLGWGSDEATWVSLSVNGGIAYSARPLCCWRRSLLNISSAGDTEMRLRSVQEFSRWYKTFLNTVEARDEIEIVLLAESRAIVEKRIENLATSVLVFGARLQRYWVPWLIGCWLKFGKRVGLTGRVFVKTALYLMGLRPYS